MLTEERSFHTPRRQLGDAMGAAAIQAGAPGRHARRRRPRAESRHRVGASRQVASAACRRFRRAVSGRGARRMPRRSVLTAGIVTRPPTGARQASRAMLARAAAIGAAAPVATLSLAAYQAEQAACDARRRHARTWPPGRRLDAGASSPARERLAARGAPTRRHFGPVESTPFFMRR